MSIEEIIEKHKKLSKIVSNYKYFSKIYKDFYIIDHVDYGCNYYADIMDSKNINYNIIHTGYGLNLKLFIKDKKTKTKIFNYDKYFQILELYEPDPDSILINDYVNYTNKLRNKNKALKEIEMSIIKFLSSEKHYSNLKVVLSDDAKKQDRINNLVANLIFA